MEMCFRESVCHTGLNAFHIGGKWDPDDDGRLAVLLLAFGDGFDAFCATEGFAIPEEAGLAVEARFFIVKQFF